jgi:hypothetical protein
MTWLRSLTCLFFLASVPVAPSHAADWTLDRLMQQLGEVRSAHASFVEHKSIAMLETPVESSGELFYTAPDRFEKRTLQPKSEVMRLEGDMLVLEQGRKKRAVNIERYPEIAAFVASIRGTLAGDRAALEQHFALSLSGDEQDWTLQLEPRTEEIGKLLSQMRISGSGSELHRIAIEQTDGDSSLMTITPVASQ